MPAFSHDLPAGVGLHALTTHHDDRGAFTELFRQEWGTGVEPVQWNAVESGAGVLRGVHCHPLHADALIVVRGRLRLGLSDLRDGSPTAGRGWLLELSADAMRLVTIPPGVGHGFHFPVPSLHIYAVDRAWDPADELGCRWDDPELGIDWGDVGVPRLSPRDAELGGLATLREELTAPVSARARRAAGAPAAAR